jgi:SAM-dependent methyltransferase
MAEGNGNGAFAYAEPRDVRRLEDCYFYHTLDLPGIGLVKGEWDLRGQFDEYIAGTDLRGKRVLDVGTASGFLTFESEKRGAREVVSFDISDAKYQHLLPFHNTPYVRDHETWRAYQTGVFDRWKNGYWMAHRAFGSKAKAFYGNVYELPEAAGPFDVAILGSVLEHLSNPVNALASVAKLTTETIVVVTDVLETEDNTARLLCDPEKPDASYNWWVLSLGIYRMIFQMIGFEIASFTEAEYRCAWECDTRRNTIVAHRKAG